MEEIRNYYMEHMLENAKLVEQKIPIESLKIKNLKGQTGIGALRTVKHLPEIERRRVLCEDKKESG